jgi:hypothetical protein
MKRIIRLTFFLLLVFNFNLYSQELKPKTAQYYRNSIIFSGIATHFDTNIGENMLALGSYTDLFDPGVELLYQFSFSSKFGLSTGANYQYGRCTSTTNHTIDRFHFGEISFPLIFRSTIISEQKHSLFISAGFYFGKLIHFTWERPARGSGWEKYYYMDHEKYYSTNYFFGDIFFNVGYSYKASPVNEFTFSPFIKYRIVDNWMGNYRKSYYYGIQINYQLNFIKL